MNDPLVSAVVPAYNAENTIGRALHSIDDQTYPHLKVIIVNDASTDDTVQCIRKRQPELSVDLTVHHHDQQQGPGKAQQTGIEQASGDVIAFLDADDRWKPTKIEAQVGQLADQQADIGFTDLEIYNRQAQKIGQRSNDFDQSTRDIIRDIFLSRICNLTPTCVFRKRILGEMDFLDEELSLFRFDHWFFMRAIANYDWIHVEEPLTERHYSGNPAARSGKRSLDQEIEALERFSDQVVCRFSFLESAQDQFLTKEYFHRIDEPGFPDERLSRIDARYLSVTDTVKYWSIYWMGRRAWQVLRRLKPW